MYFASIQQEIKQKTFWGCGLELIEKNIKDTLLSYVILIVFYTVNFMTPACSKLTQQGNFP